MQILKIAIVCLLTSCSTVWAVERWTLSKERLTVKSHTRLPSVCTNCPQPQKKVKPVQRLQDATQRIAEAKAAAAQ